MRRVGERLLADLPGAAHATIVELAESSGTSPATVTRFCRALGFDGYSALRLQIATETGRAAGAGWEVDIGREVLPSDPIDAVAGVVAGADVRAIQDTIAQLDLGTVERVAAAMAAAGRIDVYGIGGTRHDCPRVASSTSPDRPPLLGVGRGARWSHQRGVTRTG